LPKRKGIGSHESASMGNDEWLTPPELLVRLGPFDLDPCAPVAAPWPTAKATYNTTTCGLSNPWSGRVWCNPPYGSEAAPWLSKCAEHGDAIALTFARTETSWFFSQVWRKAHALLFIKGRLTFHHVCGAKAAGNSGAPSVLIAYSEDTTAVLKSCGIRGHLVCLK